MDKTNGNPFLRVPFRVLIDEQAQAIHEASLRVLQQTGYHTPVLEARQLLQDAGARIEGERLEVGISRTAQWCGDGRPFPGYVDYEEFCASRSHGV